MGLFGLVLVRLVVMAVMLVVLVFFGVLLGFGFGGFDFDFFFGQLQQGQLGSVAFAALEMQDAGVAAVAAFEARGHFLEDLGGELVVLQVLEHLAACRQRIPLAQGDHAIGQALSLLGFLQRGGDLLMAQQA